MVCLRIQTKTLPDENPIHAIGISTNVPKCNEKSHMQQVIKYTVIQVLKWSQNTATTMNLKKQPIVS